MCNQDKCNNPCCTTSMGTLHSPGIRALVNPVLRQNLPANRDRSVLRANAPTRPTFSSCDVPTKEIDPSVENPRNPNVFPELGAHWSAETCQRLSTLPFPQSSARARLSLFLFRSSFHPRPQSLRSLHLGAPATRLPPFREVLAPRHGPWVRAARVVEAWHGATTASQLAETHPLLAKWFRMRRQWERSRPVNVRNLGDEPCCRCAWSFSTTVLKVV